ncbi:hypothetical protein TNCV_720761 [Trichonephila clavipes]|nr:hypothetical protein TNCV_720761 [Trichonephila clavipes]
MYTSGSSVFEKVGTMFLTTTVSDENIEKVNVPFFDSQGMIHKDFLPEGTTMNSARYIEVLTRFRKRLRRVRPQYTPNKVDGFFCSQQCSPSHSQYRQTVPCKKGGGAN